MRGCVLYEEPATRLSADCNGHVELGLSIDGILDDSPLSGGEEDLGVVLDALERARTVNHILDNRPLGGAEEDLCKSRSLVWRFQNYFCQRGETRGLCRGPSYLFSFRLTLLSSLTSFWTSLRPSTISFTTDHWAGEK